MPTQLQFRRGTTAQNDAFTGASGEISIDTQANTMRVHDGSTAGGQTLPTLTATQTLTNKTLTSPTITGTGAIAGTFTGDITGDVTGNADTATALATARAIEISGDVTGTANFDGSAAINIAATIAANSVALGTDTTGNYVGVGATSGNGISGSVSSEGGTFTVTSNATNSNTGSTIVFRDSSGNFSAGVITATTTAARYADLAERYTADADYEPGTVLVFGGEAEVTESTQRLDKRIAGIVSTDPAYLMNSESEGVAVGLIGRLPCKVLGEIRKGDLMVASATPGHAEAWREESNPPTGSVIGKALENKTGASVDVIEVVVGKI